MSARHQTLKVKDYRADMVLPAFEEPRGALTVVLDDPDLREISAILRPVGARRPHAAVSSESFACPANRFSELNLSCHYDYDAEVAAMRHSKRKRGKS